MGVSRQTVDNWENEKDEGNNAKSGNASAPDYRVSIPRFLSLACLSMMRLRLA